MALMPALPGVAVILPSYNRPNYLVQALDSCKGADQIIIADDGSDFDVGSIAERYKAWLVAAGPKTPAQRMTCSDPPKLYNQALRLVQEPIVTYLCDDDVFAPGWINAVKRVMGEHPEWHMVRGGWNVLGTDENSFPPDFPWCLTTGNFAYRITCATEENCWWDQSTVSCHDALMLNTFMVRHNWPNGGFTVPDLGVLAGWRRVHALNMVNYMDGNYAFRPETAAVFEKGWLEG